MSDLPRPLPSDEIPGHVLRPHLVVVDMVYHQAPGESPRGTECRYATFLDSHEDPYRRKCTVGPEWTPLDLGWFEQCPQKVGYVVIENRGSGVLRNTIPTEEEQEAERGLVLIMGLELLTDQGPCVVRLDTIPRGDTRRLMPADPADLRLQSPAGPCVVHLTVYPR